MVTAPTERRAHARYTATPAVQLHHELSQLEFPGRCQDISCGGMLVFLPSVAPLKEGHSVTLEVGQMLEDALPDPLPAFAGQYIQATVTRVDRRAILTTGHLVVGVQFDETA